MTGLWHISEPLPFGLWPGEAEIVTALPDISTSQFAAAHRMVTIGAHQGKWDNDITPYLTEIMDTADLPHVHKLVICGPEQSGKTNACINIHLKDLVYNGGNAKFIMFPTESLAKTVATTRLIPIYKSCEPIARKISASPDDTAAGKIALRDGTIVFPAWGTSAARISSFPSDFTWGDEVDKNADLTGNESDPLKLLEKRTRTFRSFLNLICSTTTEETGHVWRELQSCAVIMHFQVVCPHCGEVQLMVEERLTWPGQLALVTGNSATQPDADPNQIKSSRSARYVCSGCSTLWDDIDRNRAVKLAIKRKLRGDKTAWQPNSEVSRPASVGFHITGFICPDISLSDIAAAIIKARSGDESAEKERDNSYIGIPHRRKQIGARKEEHILRLVDPYLPTGIVPPDTSTIIIKADTQQNGFMYQVVAASYGPDVSPTLIEHGFVESFSALKDIESSEYRDATGKVYRAHAGFIDSGGGSNPYQPKHSRTVEVYDFCRVNKFWRPLKGRRDQATPWSITRLDYYPSRDGKKRPIPGGLNLYTINVTHYKNQLATKLEINPGDPGSIRLHAGLAADGPHGGRQYAAQLCAEYRDPRGYWECPRGKANHFWDCWTYYFAAADILGVDRKKRADNEQQTTRQRTIYSQGVNQ